MNFIIEHIKKEPSVTLNQLAELIFVKFNISVVVNTIKNWLDGELFTLKSVRPMVQNANRAENKIKRMQYLESLHESRSIYIYI